MAEAFGVKRSDGVTARVAEDSAAAPATPPREVEVQLFAMQFRRLTVTLKFPRKHSCMSLVVTLRFAFRRLMFFAKMRARGFVAFQRVDAH